MAKDVKIASEMGLHITDIHRGNILTDPRSGRTSWIDVGQTFAVSSAKARETAVSMREEIEETLKKTTEAISQKRKQILPSRRTADSSVVPNIERKSVNEMLRALQQQSAQQIIAEHSISGGRGHLSRSSDRSVVHASSAGKIKPGQRGR